MGVMPDKKIDKLGFCEAHVTPWTTNAVAIGTTAPAVTDFSSKTTAARAAYVVKQAAEEALRSANGNFDMALTAATTAAAEIIKQVRAKAATGGDSIYTLAALPIPAIPSPIPPPGQPTDIKVKLTATGALDMKWKCANPPGASGTIYNIFRRVGDSGEFTYVGGSGVREFTDESAPAGVPLLMYRMQAVRSTTVGPWATFNVFLGVDTGGGAMVASVVNTTTPTSPKMAA